MKNKRNVTEFVGTRSEACELFFSQLALASIDSTQREYYQSLASFYRKRQSKDKRNRFKVVITNVN